MAEMVGRAFIGALSNEVILMAKEAYRCKGECNKLAATLEALGPHLLNITEYADHGNATCQTWLKDVRSLLVEANGLVTKCVPKNFGFSFYSVFKYVKRPWLSLKLQDIQCAMEGKLFQANMLTLNIAPRIKVDVHGFKDDVGDLSLPSCVIDHPRSLQMQHISSHLVAFESDLFKKLKKSILCSPLIGTKFIGIKGRGGVGKTMLAKMVSNDKDIKEKYGFIMWITIGQDVLVSAVYSMVGKFLNDGGVKFEIDRSNSDLESQRTYLMNAFVGMKVLVILDDVWGNMEKSHPMIYWLDIFKGAGSTTLVTTRDTEVLVHAKATHEIEVKSLSDEESWKLFSFHAFQPNMPLSCVVKDIAKKICDECKGLPLALEVIGGALWNKKNERDWAHALSCMKNSKSWTNSSREDELLHHLKYSYDILPEDAKKCFLYFAAFPKDYQIPTKELYSVWQVEQLFGSCDDDTMNIGRMILVTLADQSLIDLDDDGKNVKIHNILHDLAIRIVQDGKPGEWAHECQFESGKVLKTLPKIRATTKRVSIVGSHIQIFNPQHFIEGQNQVQVYLLSNMRFGHEGIPITILPTNFFSEMTSLLYLSLTRWKSLKVLPESIKELKSLTHMDLRGCKSLEQLPESIKALKPLTCLDLNGCSSLKELPKSIKELKSLVHLDLSWCSSLKELPECIKELESLTHFVIRGCSSLKDLPKSIKELKSLTHLDLNGCKSLKELPDSIKELKSLTHLDLSWCSSLKELPECIKELESLTHLNLYCCTSLKDLPESMKALKSLTHLDLSGCSSLKELPESIKELKSLMHLGLRGCSSLKELPESIKALKPLTHLDLSGCSSLTELPKSIKELKSLMHLDLSWCSSLEELPECIKELESLTHLNLYSCKSLKELPQSIKELKSLMYLDLHGCSSLKKLPENIKELKSLMHLDLSWCSSLKELPESIKELKSLTHLDLSDCWSLKELPKSIMELKSLTHLDLSGCWFSQEHLESIKELKSLAQLDLKWHEFSKELVESGKKLQSPTHLDQKWHDPLKVLPESGKGLKSHTHLDRKWHDSLKMLPESGKGLKSLTRLDLKWHEPLKELREGDKELKYLSHFDLSEIDDMYIDDNELDNNIYAQEYNDETSGVADFRAPNALELPSSSTTVLEDQRHELDMLVDVDNVEFQVEKDVAEGVPLHLYKAMFSGSGYVESIIAALDLCETQVREFKKLLLFVRVFRHQCTKLVETLKPTAVNVFGRCRKVMDGLQKLEAGGSGLLSGNRSKSCVRFCFESLVGLARNSQLVVDLLRKCASEDLPKTALDLADLPSDPYLMSRRWTKFSLTIRNCEWCMDLVEFAFYTLETLLAGGTHIPGDVSFKWCEEKCRLVFQSEGRLGREGKTLEKCVRDGDYELEAQDLTDLIGQLRRLAEASESVEYADLAGPTLRSAGSDDDAVDFVHFADSAGVGSLADPSDLIMQQMLKVDATHSLPLSEVVFNRARMADFLSKKLSGVPSHAERPPGTFRVTPSSLKFREVLDSRGSGVVHEYAWLGESVAVKTVSSPGLTWQQFEEEAALLAVVQHPNVVRLIGCDFIDERKTGMLVMELMDHDLRTVIESKLRELGPGSSPFATNVAIDIILQIAEAMRHMRNHGVVYRGLKTKNILVNVYKPLNPSGVLDTQCSDLACALPHLQEEYVVKINEIGLAKGRPRSSSMGGTSRWIAPEVSHVHELDGAQDYEWPADVYSFAMTCFEILTGKLPFANYPDDAIPERAILAGMRPEGLDEVEVPNLLKKLVKQCWAKHPNERPSFEEIVKSLWECRLEAISPVLIGDKLLIDLTKDLLGVSSTGYVIRTSCAGMQGRGQPCALKRIDVMDNNNEVDLARLNHPHVVQLIDHWIEKKFLFLIMELMDGDLAKLMARTKKPRASPFTLHVNVDLMLQIALGMRHLHEMGVSHPHLMCENVLYRVAIKAEAYQVGDVRVKLGGFGWSRPADAHSKNRDVVCFGQTCLEILTGIVNSEMVSKSSIPETTPDVLKDCIVSCLDTPKTFENVVEDLLRAKSYITQCCKDETICSSEVIQTQSVPTKSDSSLDEIFTVHQLHPQSGDASTSIRATLVFFHGFHKVPEEWRRTWMTRDNKLVWPQKWLPEDLGSENIRVLSVSFDANSNVSNKYNRHEIGKNLVEGLILGPRWKLGETGEAIFLIGHSFGGVLIKSFVTEAQNFSVEQVQNNAQERAKCMMFLKNLAEVVFYSVPHAALAPVEFERYISECRKVVPLQRSSFLQSLREDTSFIKDMCKLSVDFEGALPENVKVLAFLEGKPMSMKRVLVTEKSFEGLSRPWEWHKVDKDNHFEVSRPESKNHIGYKILLDHLRQYMI